MIKPSKLDLGCLNLCPLVLEARCGQGWTSQGGREGGPVPGIPLPLVLLAVLGVYFSCTRRLCLVVFSPCAHPFFYKDTNHIGFGPALPHYDFTLTGYIYSDPISKSGHILKHWGTGGGGMTRPQQGKEALGTGWKPSPEAPFVSRAHWTAREAGQTAQRGGQALAVGVPTGQGTDLGFCSQGAISKVWCSTTGCGD